MHKNKYLHYGFIVLTLLMATKAYADIFDDIALAIKSGNSREVAQFFNNRVELRIGNEENVYSKTQAEMMLKEFFTQNKPLDFTIIHRGSSEKGARYAIGNLKTSKGNYRTYFFVKEIGDRLFIQELRFEKD